MGLLAHISSTDVMICIYIYILYIHCPFMYVGYVCFCVLESLYSNLSSPKGDMLNLMYTAIADQLTIMDFLPLQNSSKTDVAIPWRCTCDIMRFENPPVEKRASDSDCLVAACGCIRIHNCT